MHVYRYIHITCYRNKASIHIYIYLYTIGCCFQSMTESTSHGCFPGTPWGDKKYPCRFTVKKNIQVRDCWAHHVSCISILHVFTFSGSKEKATFSEKNECHPKQSCIFCSFEGKNKGNACLTSRRVKQSCTFNWLYLAGRRSRLLQQNAR